MRVVRLFVDLSLQPGRVFELPDSAATHVSRVLRMRVDDEVQLFNGDGNQYCAKINHVDKRSVGVYVASVEAVNKESPLQIHLLQGVSRGDKMDLTVQKAVELGVHAIYPVISERCGVQLDAERWQKKQDHWQAIAQSACEQSGRNFVPKVHEVRKLDLVLSEVNTPHRFTLDPQGEKSFSQQTINGAISLLIGPEGGLGDLDLYQAKAAKFTGVNMGPRILRTETAALTALSILQSHFGDLA